MATIRDKAVTINAAATASMVCNMPTHVSGDLLVAFVAKDANTAFTTPTGWEAIKTVISAGAAGGVYIKTATSGSETVTFALTSEECCAVILSVAGQEATIDSGAGALTINVVAAGLTFTRTTGSFTTDGFSVGQTVIMSGFTNAGNNGPKEIVSITGSGTILTVTSDATLVNETGNNNERVISTGLDKCARNVADDTSLPLTGIGVTPVNNDCLILHGLIADIGASISALPPWVNIFPIDTGTASLSVSYSYLPTAAAITAPDHWAGIITGVDERSVIITVRNAATVTRPPYIPLSTTPSSMITPLCGLDAVDKGAWVAAASIAITTVNGKTVTGVTIANTLDAGYNPFRAAATTAGVSSTTNLGHSEFNLTSTFNITTLKSLLFGTYRCTIPRDYLDLGKPSNGGVYILAGSTTANYKVWVVGGQFDKETDPAARQNYLIEVTNSDTVYVTAGTADFTAADYWAFGSSGYYGAASVAWNELWSINEIILAGGSSTGLVTFDDVITTVNSGAGNIPLIQQAGALATVWCPIRFGGTTALFIDLDLNTFQLPRRADESNYTHFHCTNDKLGFEFYGLANDVFTFTNCLFTSPSSYYWRFNASASASATYDFSGTTVVGATITLKDVTTFTGMSFIQSTSIDASACDLLQCTITAPSGSNFDEFTVSSTSTIRESTFNYPYDSSNIATTAFPNVFSDCTFNGPYVAGAGTGGDTVCGLSINTAGTYTLDGNTFNSYGPTERSFRTMTDVNSGTDVITLDATHNFTTGDRVEYLKHGGSNAIGITDGNTYYVRSISTTTITLHSSNAGAIADTGKENLTAAGSDETHWIASECPAINITASGTTTLNITGGVASPSVRTKHASGVTIINNLVTVTLTGLVDPTEVRVYEENTTTVVDGQEDVTTGTFAFDAEAGSIVDIRIFSVGYLPADILSYTIPASATSIPIQQVFDRVYENE